MLNFDHIPKVAYDEMNRVHAEEIILLNTLETRLNTDDIPGIEHTLHTLLKHTKEHFANEEKLMQEVGFPPYMMHKGEHDRVFSEMNDVIAQWQISHNPALLRNYFFEIIPQWLTQHISTMDTITAQFICMRKGCA